MHIFVRIEVFRDLNCRLTTPYFFSNCRITIPYFSDMPRIAVGGSVSNLINIIRHVVPVPSFSIYILVSLLLAVVSACYIRITGEDGVSVCFVSSNYLVRLSIE